MISKYAKTLVVKKVCEITFDDIIELQAELKHYIELEKELRKNATRDKAKMLDKYIKKFHIPKKSWRDVHYSLDFAIGRSKMFEKYLEDLPQGSGC